jgi:hypothetical protein
MVWQIPDAVGTVVCAPDNGWWYHPKHVEQFPEKINCVTLHLDGYILEHDYCKFLFASSTGNYFPEVLLMISVSINISQTISTPSPSKLEKKKLYENPYHKK